MEAYRIEIPDRHPELKVGLGIFSGHRIATSETRRDFREINTRLSRYLDSIGIDTPYTDAYSGMNMSKVCFFTSLSSAQKVFKRCQKRLTRLGFQIVRYDYPNRELKYTGGQFIARHDTFTGRQVVNIPSFVS